MRNRVALKAARTRAVVMSKLVRVSVVMALVPVALVAVGRTASATESALTLAEDHVAAQSMAFPVGPVGIAAVVVGFGGLVVGLLRLRRRDAGTAAMPAPVPTAQPPAAESATGERAA